MNLNEKIDLILKQFDALGDSEVFDNIYNALDFEHKSDGDLRLVKNKMFEEGLIDTRNSHEMVFFITPNGQEIQNNGGWLRYIEIIDKENSRISELAQIEEDKLRWDAKLSKLKA